MSFENKGPDSTELHDEILKLAKHLEELKGNKDQTANAGIHRKEKK